MFRSRLKSGRSEDKFEDMKREIDYLEREKSELIQKSNSSGGNLNIIKIVLVFVVFALLGNFLGKKIGLS